MIADMQMASVQLFAPNATLAVLESRELFGTL